MEPQDSKGRGIGASNNPMPIMRWINCNQGSSPNPSGNSFAPQALSNTSIGDFIPFSRAKSGAIQPSGRNAARKPSSIERRIPPRSIPLHGLHSALSIVVSSPVLTQTKKVLDAAHLYIDHSDEADYATLSRSGA